VQELEESIARQLAQAGQWKYSIPWMSFLVEEWGLDVGEGSFLAFLVSMSLTALLSGSFTF